MELLQPKPKPKYTHLRTFVNRAANLAEARERHEMVEQCATATKLAPALLENLWLALAHGFPDHGDTALDRAVDVTTPIELLPLLRAGDDLPVAAAFVLAVQAMEGANVGDDMSLRAALETAWAKLSELAAESQSIQEGFGCDRANAWRTLRKVRTVSGSQEFRRKIMQIAELAGAMHQSMSRVGNVSKVPLPHEVERVAQGGPVEDLMPAEFARLADRETADAQAMAILRGEAATRKMAGNSVASRGPLVVLIDESGSMHDEDGRPGRNTWAKAAALALARIAFADSRPVVAVHFGTATAVHVVSSEDGLLELVQSFVGGGTAFAKAMSVGFAEAVKLSTGGKTADVVIMSDGQEEMGGALERQALDKILDQMDALKMRLWSVAIGRPWDDDFPLRKRAEKYVFAHDHDLKLRRAAVQLATALTGAATNVSGTGGDLN